MSDHAVLRQLFVQACGENFEMFEEICAATMVFPSACPLR